MEEINEVLLKMKDISYGYFMKEKIFLKVKIYQSIILLIHQKRLSKTKWEYVGTKLS